MTAKFHRAYKMKKLKRNLYFFLLLLCGMASSILLTWLFWNLPTWTLQLPH